VPILIREKKATIAKIHIMFLRDTASASDLVSVQQSAALGSVIAPVTMASTCHLLFCCQNLLIRTILKIVLTKISLPFAMGMPHCGILFSGVHKSKPFAL
jgi:hypothetical protein